MIKLEHVVLPSPVQWAAIIRGMRNPKNSWDRSDTVIFDIEDDNRDHLLDINFNELPTLDCETFLKTIQRTMYGYYPGPRISAGPNDIELMNQLASGGPVHAKYRRMITVYVDITAPLYWWKEFDTYKIGTVANSCSTMHKIHEKEFTLEDFSHEHLYKPDDLEGMYYSTIAEEEFTSLDVLKVIIEALNIYRKDYLTSKDKKYWWQMIQLLPSSYNQKRTVMLNYEVLTNIYKWRKDHKLDEWREFCKWIEELPYSELITGFSFK